MRKSIKSTVSFMISDDYKERFVAEYWQTKIRYEKLHRMIIKYEAGTLKFTPVTPLHILEEQARFMGLYLKQLELRAELEGVRLFEEDENEPYQ